MKPPADLKISLCEDNSDYGIIRALLTSFNEKTLGVERKTALITASINDEIIDGVSFRWYGESGFIDVVAVAEKWRGQGIGTRLVKAVEEELQRRGCRQICVATASFQAPDLYRNLDYKHVATVPKYLCGHDHFTFIKILSEHKGAAA